VFSINYIIKLRYFSSNCRYKI